MAYVTGNPKSKKALKEQFAQGDRLEVFQPGIGSIPKAHTTLSPTHGGRESTSLTARITKVLS